MKKALAVLILAFILMTESTAVFAGAKTDSMAAGNSFNDVSGHWAQEAINKVADKSIFADKNGNFAPGKAITRAEFAVMLHKTLGVKITYLKKTDINEFFDDVKNENFCASALYDLVITNIIDCKDKFKPDEALSRQDMVHYIINSLEYKTGGKYALIKMMPVPFADALDINPAYNNDFMKAQLLKLVYGHTDNKFYPATGASRAEASVVVYRLLKVLDSLKAADGIDVIPSAEVFMDCMNLQLVIANNTQNSITINHSSGQKYDFILLDADKKEIYKWSSGMCFTMALTETIIKPGESAAFSQKLQGEAYNKVKGKAVYVKGYINGKCKDFTINKEGYEEKIK